ncbi:hyaluronan mediated motility receptor isoform X3 [Hydra vulgaris]|uniref:Hyaluronan mediated motility receptor isoform X3 n=1 Tax=Hydra vulgaris TaxID=6087 RepID=A0ABM4D956_HYDVU
MFSKSKTKRFQDPVSCAPPPGSYNIPDIKKVNLVSFDKSKRFNEPKDVSSSILSSSSDSSSMAVYNQSTCKKPSKIKQTLINEKSLSVKDISLDNDMCRKSLEADMEFQESKVNSLLHQIQTLEKQMESLKVFSSELEESNYKLHEVIESLRHEKLSIQNEINGLSIKLKENLEKHDEEKAKVIEQINLQHNRVIENLNQEHFQENEALNQKLVSLQDLNCDFREQLESIEQTMSENLLGITKKYEALESTLSYVQKDYSKRLENSNLMLERANEEHKRSENELQSMIQISNSLKKELQQMADQNNIQMQNLNEKELLLNEHKENEKVLSITVKALEESKNSLSLELEKLFLELQRTQEQSVSEQERLVREIEYNKSLSNRRKEETERLEEENKNLKNSLDEKSTMVSELYQKLETTKVEEDMKSKSLLQDVKGYKEEITMLCNQLQSLKEEFLVKQREKDEIIKESKIMHEEVVRRLMETQIKLTKAEEIKEHSEIQNHDIYRLHEEIKLWKEKYDILAEKTGPFMDQLDKFQAEKDVLLYENAASQVELGKLSEKYAMLLGHQNNKQKIHHVRKLKEENCSLKMEVLKLKSVIAKFQKESNSQSKRLIDDLSSSVLRQPLKEVNS